MPSGGRLLRIAGLILAALAIGLMALRLWPSLPALQSDLGLLHDVIDRGQGWRDRNPAPAALAFLGAFSLAGALPLPVIVALTLAGGAFFGFWLGLALSLLGTVAAALLTFWTARHLLTLRVRRALGNRVQQLDRVVAEDGALALLSLRLTPGLPFFVLNTACGLSTMPVRVFAGITALGVLPNKAILSAAGTQLAEIDHVSDIVGPRIVAVVVLLAVFPWIARGMSRRLRRTASAQKTGG
ncbi:TVP38/TMEM64 family protein [Paracoccus sp. (in: a-proteobacteria)]|uniref:TVP38/TMEM64 family protein n=1 Tax=Paracoccus sp. TaxID=267 RepID=UPI00396CD3F5